MNFDEYQAIARTTAIYPSEFKILYPALGLGNEAGEVQGKLKKVLRDNNGAFNEEQIAAIKDELGDVLWYVSALANDLQISLQEVALRNVEKLLSRQARGTISGSGDTR